MTDLNEALAAREREDEVREAKAFAYNLPPGLLLWIIGALIFYAIYVVTP